MNGMIARRQGSSPDGEGAAGLQLIVGRDRDDHWVVMETRGLCGGIFASAEAAIRYARSEAAGRSGAVRLAEGDLAFGVEPFSSR